MADTDPIRCRQINEWCLPSIRANGFAWNDEIIFGQNSFVVAHLFIARESDEDI